MSSRPRTRLAAVPFAAAVAVAVLTAGPATAATGATMGGHAPGGGPAQRSVATAVPGWTKAGTAATPPKACNSTDMSGCFSYAQTKQVADYSVKYVDRAVNRMYPRLTRPAHFWYIPAKKSYRWCEGTMTDTSFGYCFLDQTIAMGQRTLWDFYDRAGDAAPLFAVAHEYAHHIQRLKGVPAPVNAAGSVRFENQADCLAGAIVRQLRREKIFTDADLRDVDDLIPMIASAEGAGRDHGTYAERVKATYTGIRYGARTCSRYIPRAPKVG